MTKAASLCHAANDQSQELAELADTPVIRGVPAGARSREVGTSEVDSPGYVNWVTSGKSGQDGDLRIVS